MSIRQSIKASLALLKSRDQRLLWLVVAIQFLVALLDLAGILLLGIVATHAAASISGTSVAGDALGSFVGSRQPVLGSLSG